MNITSIELFRYSLPLVDALQIKAHSLIARSGLIVRVRTEDGAAGHGEIAPLPGYSPDTLDEAAQQAAALASALAGEAIPEGIAALEGGFARWLGPRAAAPSVRFGFELAILNALAAGQGFPLRRLLSETPLDAVPIGGLLNGNLGEIRKKATYLKGEGYKAVKLKVGRYDVATDVQTAVWLSEHLGDAIALRLDANRAWDFNVAVAFAEGIAGREIEFIEEPVQNPARMAEFAERTGIPVAMDETLQDTAPEDFHASPYVKAVVLKPTVLGLERAVRLGRRARERGVMPIFSSTYESGFGLMALAELAAAVQPEGASAGLDTYEWLDGDVLKERAPLRRPVLHLADLEPYAAAFDEGRLQAMVHG